jgi:hypothetical protein
MHCRNFLRKIRSIGKNILEKLFFDDFVNVVLMLFGFVL